MLRRRGERSHPTTCSAVERRRHAGFKWRLTQLDDCLFMAAAVGRVHGGLPRPSYAANQTDLNICERRRESSAEAGEQFQPLAFSVRGSIRERDLDKTDQNQPRQTCSRGALCTDRALICKSKEQLHFLLRQLTFRHLRPAHLVNS